MARKSFGTDIELILPIKGKPHLKLFLRKVNSRCGFLSGKAGPPGSEVRVPEEGGGRQRGEGREELVALKAHAEVLVQETRGPVPLVPPVTEHQRYDRHLETITESKRMLFTLNVVIAKGHLRGGPEQPSELISLGS